MSEIWEQYLNRKPDPKTVLTREMLRKELGDERKNILIYMVLGLIPVVTVFGFLIYLAINDILLHFLIGLANINPGIFLHFLLLVVLCGGCAVICVKLVKHMIRLHRVRDKGVKIVKAKVTNMRTVFIDDVRRRRSGPRHLFYVTFPIYGEVCLQNYDYESTGKPIYAGDLYFSTNVGDEYYLLVFESNGEVIKVFPAELFELSEEVQAWLQ